MAELGAVRIRAPAKINLFLRVLAREVTGYHQIETLFAAVDLCDELQLERRDRGVSIDVRGADVGPDDENLACRAARRLLEEVGTGGGVHIRLRKVIPAGAGLGGGSSDGGATLRGLNLLLGGPLSRPSLVRLAGELGADVAFFASGVGRALAWGRGERLMPLPAGDDLAVLLALPSVSVSTVEAYQRLGPVPRATPSLLDPAVFESSERFREVSVNDFEPSVFGRHPELGALRKQMATQEGALLARLSGTGGAVFALFEEPALAESARRSVTGSWPDVRFLVTRPMAVQPGPILRPHRPPTAA